MNEDTLTLPPPEHDYVISFTGLSWSVRRSNGVGAFFSISEGNRDRRIAVEKVLSLAESDHTDVWNRRKRHVLAAQTLSTLTDS
jgi:hypothetical protein